MMAIKHYNVKNFSNFQRRHSLHSTNLNLNVLFYSTGTTDIINKVTKKLISIRVFQAVHTVIDSFLHV